MPSAKPAKKTPTRKTAAKTPARIAPAGVAKVTTARKAPPRRSVSSVAKKAQGRSGTIRGLTAATTRRAEDALTAAAQVIEPGDSNAASESSPTKAWQMACTGYARTIPELSASKMWVGNCMSRIHLTVGKRNPDGSIGDAFDGAEPAEGLDPKMVALASDIISHMRSPIGGQPELLRSYGEKMFIAGEAFVLPTDTPAGIAYSVLSIMELKKTGGRWIRYQGPGLDSVPVPDGVAPIRVWRPDDIFEQLATSSVRSCMEILEELQILTRLVRSSAISRMALSGILCIADEWDVEDTEGEDDSEQEHPLLYDIILNGAKAIDDPASAAAWLPYLMTGPASLIENGIKLIDFKSSDSIQVVQRTEVIERLAQGLDVQKEVVLGHQDTTFANAAQVSEDSYKVHLQPMAQMLDDALTIGVLWPAMAKAMNLSAKQVADGGYPDEMIQIVVSHDASDLVAHPDKVTDIVNLFIHDPTQTSVKISEVREAVDLDGTGAPDDAEVARRIDAVRLTKIREMINADPGDAAVAISQADKAVVPGASQGERALEDGTALTPAVKKVDDEAGTQLAVKIAAAADLMMERCADKTGAKLRQKIRDDDQRLTVAGLQNHEVAHALGATLASQILNGDDPTVGEMASFERTVARWADDAGIRGGVALAKGVSHVVGFAIDERLYGERRPELNIEALTALVAAAPVGV